jgi:release factor glutamine methyltransferase
LAQAQQAPAEADLLLAHQLQRDRSYLLAYPEAELTPAQMVDYTQLIAQRCAGTPVAYLLGCRDFWDLTLRVNRHTLIPRSETEHLVEQALQLGPTTRAWQVLELGTGSGAIALALAQARPTWQVTAADISPDALAVAQHNATQHQLTNVRFVHSDWFSALTGRYHLVVSNPPYVAADDPHLTRGDLRFEPRSALVAGPDGLAAIRHLVKQAPAWLYPGGWLLLEHGATQGAACRTLLQQSGYGDICTHQDLAGLDRLSGGRHPSIPIV